MPDAQEKIYDSPRSEPDDQLWLEHGTKLVGEQNKAIEATANSLMSVLGVILGFIQAIYLAILGFSNTVPVRTSARLLFLVPIVFWLAALYLCIRVVLARAIRVNPYSPDDLRSKLEQLTVEKQINLKLAFWMLAIGLVVALVLVLFGSKLG